MVLYRSLSESKSPQVSKTILGILAYFINHHLIMLSCHLHGYPWPSHATPPNRSSLPAGPQGYTLYPHRDGVCRFELVAPLLLGHVKGSIGVHHLHKCYGLNIPHPFSGLQLLQFFSNALKTVPCAPAAISITLTLMFQLLLFFSVLWQGPSILQHIWFH